MLEFEDDEKIKNIKRRLENTPKSVLNEKYVEDINYLLDLVSRQYESKKVKEMGYRLDINNSSGKNYYGSKLYGYVDNEHKLKSYKYLYQLGKFDGSEYFGYSASNKIELTYQELINFLSYYNIDMIEYKQYYDFLIDKDIIELINKIHYKEKFKVRWV